MNFEKIKSVDHQFTSSETNAILCVLPLISLQSALTQKMRKGQTDAYTKLVHGSDRFKTHEFEAIASSVELSILMMSGKAPDLSQKVQRDAEWFEEIKSFFFVLNDLHTQFRRIASDLALDS